MEKNNILKSLDKNPKADPNKNYNTFEKILTDAVNKYIPDKQIKYRKYKHKNSDWISFGIIKSIKFRDSLYKRLKQTEINSPEYLNLKLNLNTYNKILKRLIREA